MVVVQHMPAMFTQKLAQRLDTESCLRVKEAVSEEALQPGTVYVAPGGFHLELVRQRRSVTTLIHQGPEENSCRPAVDVLFRSAARVYRRGCLAMVLTGMGNDGLEGAKQIVLRGGALMAQDAATSTVWGMPRAIDEAGLGAAVLPIHDLAQELLRRCRAKRRSLAGTSP